MFKLWGRDLFAWCNKTYAFVKQIEKKRKSERSSYGLRKTKRYKNSMQYYVKLQASTIVEHTNNHDDNRHTNSLVTIFRDKGHVTSQYHFNRTLSRKEESFSSFVFIKQTTKYSIFNTY